MKFALNDPTKRNCYYANTRVEELISVKKARRSYIMNENGRNNNVIEKDLFKPLEYGYFYTPIGENENMVFHSFEGEPFVMNDEEIEALKGHEIDIENVEYNDSVNEKARKRIEEYIENYHGPYVLDFIISETCNLGCHMCFHRNTLSNCQTRNTCSELSTDFAEKWLHYYIDMARSLNFDKYSFHFGAAEPFIYKLQLWGIIELINTTAIDKPKEIFINTNLTLIDDDDIRKMKKYGVRVAVGLDGIGSVNDKIRHYFNSKKGTYDIIIENIKKLVREGIQVGVNLTLTDRNFDYVDIHKFIDVMDAVGIKHLLIDSDMVSHISYNADQIVEKYLMFLEYGESKGMEINGSWRTPYDMIMTENTDIPKSFCASQLGKNFAITPSGGISFCTYSGRILAEDNNEKSPDEVMKTYVAEMKEFLKKIFFNRNEANCKECPLEGFCLGGCQLSHETYGKNNFMCDIYLKSTKALIDYYIKL